MPLSWNEIRHNAIRFAKEWQRSSSESADKQTFWNEFFVVFGIPRKTVASFEVPVLNTSGNFGKIDLLWKGVMLVEHKSAGEDLGKAKTQAFDYIQAMAAEGRHREIPRYVAVSDFGRIVLYDLEPEEPQDLPLFKGHRVVTAAEFALQDFHRHIHAFAFIPGYKQHKFEEQDPINIEATEMLGELHDALEAGGYRGHDLERFLVRVVFCLFAEDTGLFQREAFRLYIDNRTAEDGSDLGPRLAQLFGVLNTPEDQRQKNLDEELQPFPCVNGDLFSERLGFAEFNRDMRNALLACTRFDWSRISPAIFGSLFQAVMEPKERRQIGGHYTSERDILKVIRSLFLDDLRAELNARKTDRSTARAKRLKDFHVKLCRLKFLDPACGCGNFLVITYRELRALELEILKELFGAQKEFSLDEINRLSQVDVDQFYGIEIGEWPARIAEVALWLMDHQMNLKVSTAFGQLYQRLPLKKSPHIHCANALRLDWRQVLLPGECGYVLGNPPFVGKQFMTAEQKADMDAVCGHVKGSGVLDFVTAWYFKAAEYVKGAAVRCAFVSTNSISQGEQPGILWGELYGRHRLKIQFAHRTFPWESEARGKAHVHVVIIGFGAADVPAKFILDCDGDLEHPTRAQVVNINPYLVEGGDTVLAKRATPICAVPEIVFGSMPNDGGHLLLDREEKAELLRLEPMAAKFVRRFVGAEEFINGVERWCLWLAEATAAELRAMPEVLRRVEAVRNHRLKSTRATTRALANQPSLFGENRQPSTNYLLIPGVSSESRSYIPIGFLKPDIIASNLVNIVPGATLYHFGVLTSAMHMAWVKHVCGRLESRFRYSNQIVYNNFPWPLGVSEAQRDRIEAAARGILALRVECGDGRHGYLPVRTKTDACTLADLYDPVVMPPELRKAHAALDRAVDHAYRKGAYGSDRERVEFLFGIYEQLTAPLAPTALAKPKRARRKKETVYAPTPSPPPAPQHPGSNPDQAWVDAAHHYFGKEEPPPYRTG